jgi:hypothetical protein
MKNFFSYRKIDFSPFFLIRFLSRANGLRWCVLGTLSVPLFAHAKIVGAMWMTKYRANQSLPIFYLHHNIPFVKFQSKSVEAAVIRVAGYK